MINNICSICMLLAQNDMEKRLTKIGLAFFAVFMLVLIIDSTAKSKLVPKNKYVHWLLIFLFIMTITALVLLIIYYK